jgi:hypothetical protein
VAARNGVHHRLAGQAPHFLLLMKHADNRCKSGSAVHNETMSTRSSFMLLAVHIRSYDEAPQAQKGPP